MTVAQQSSVGFGPRERSAEGDALHNNAERFGCTESRQESRATVNGQSFHAGRFLVTEKRSIDGGPTKSSVGFGPSVISSAEADGGCAALP